MLPISELNFGFSDAENYKNKEYKDLFNHIFVRTAELDKLCKSNVFFLVGEKGTGKTAYAIYLVNNSYKNNRSVINYIRETEYQKFVALKKEKHLTLSDYTNIWKVIIYLLIAERIEMSDIATNVIGGVVKFRALKKVIAEYYNNAFSPEIIYAINFAEQSKLAAEIMAKCFKVGGGKTETMFFSEAKFQVNLLYIQKKFEEVFNSLKLKRNHLLFIDGIDIRPSAIPYEDYLECVKGLANAVWGINCDFFSSIKDSPGRMRVVLLIRPDIFHSLGLQNQNNKIRDNSVLLDWRTTYPEYKNSSLFAMADRLLSAQQKEKLGLGGAWRYYFPYEAIDHRYGKRRDSPFVTFLRFSLFRPRDIISMLKILQENFIQQKRRQNELFREIDFDAPIFRRKYSEYLLGEVKDHLSFYHGPSDYELFLKFFEYLSGKPRFTYEEFIFAYDCLITYLERNEIKRPQFFEAPDIFLQFLYDANVICYAEDTEEGPYISWCFRDRNYSNIYPKVKSGLRYEVHYGLGKALNLGKSFIRR